MVRVGEPTNAQRVERWIGEAFDLSAVTVTPVAYLPGARLIRDREGRTLLVWWDVGRQRVEWRAR